MSAAPPLLYLASRSPRRRELLAQVGIHFELLPFRTAPREDAEVNEAVRPGETAEAYACRVALAKAEHAVRLSRMRHLPPRLVLSADTTLDVDGEIVGKPAGEDEALAILRRLSGRSHRVLTAVAVADERRAAHVLSVSEVRFRSLDDDELRRYVRSGEPLDKAGAYGIQGRAAMFVEEIRGSHSGIVGLPLCETVLLLRRFAYPI
jgi:septum formation protein